MPRIDGLNLDIDNLFESKEPFIGDDTDIDIDTTHIKDDGTQSTKTILEDQDTPDENEPDGSSTESTSKSSFQAVDPKSTEKQNTQNSSFEDYTSEIESLIEKGLITEQDIPDDLNQEGKVISKDEYLNLLETKLTSVTDFGRQDGITKLLTSLPEGLQNAIDIAYKGQDPTTYLKSLIEVSDFTTLNPEVESDAEKIVREYYKTVYPNKPEKISSIIDRLKTNETLIEEATSLKPEIDEILLEKANKQKAASDKIASDILAKKDAMAKKTVDVLIKGIDDKGFSIKFKREEAQNILLDITEEKDFKYTDSVSQKKTTLEYLIDYHLLSEKGEPFRAVMARLLLDPSGDYDEKILSYFKNKAVDKFTEDTIKTNNKKFGNKTNAPSKTPVSSGKFFPKK